MKAARGDLGHYGLMAVPQGDDVERGVPFQLCGRPPGQERRPSFVRGRRALAELVPGSRDPIGKAGTEIGVDPAEQPARGPATQYQPQDSVPEIPRPEPITVGHESGLALDADPYRLLVEIDADFAPQKVTPPPVVVAPHDEYRHPGFDHVRQKGENPDMSGENHAAILEPEVEEVAVDDQAAARFLDVQEPAAECLLGFARNGAEVDIGDEEDGSGGHDAEARKTGGEAVDGVERAGAGARTGFVARGFLFGAARRSQRMVVVGALPGLLATLGCAGSALQSAPPLSPSDVDAEVSIATDASRIGQPVQLTFAWRAREPDFRWDGIGVARVEPPDKARLDLFLDNGETAAIAALVGDELRVPAALPLELVPPPALLWAVLGVFRPGDRAEVLEGRRADGVTELRFGLPGGDQVRFRMRGRRVVEAAVLQGGDEVERVVVARSGDESAYPVEAIYRNLRDYRELELRLESFENVDSFPPHIWDPGSR